jgi:hypothetical protein
MASVWGELKRRKVVRVAVTYAVVGWLLAQVADMIIPALLLPDWVLRALVVFILFGFPVALILAWSYEIIPDDGDRSTDDTRKEPSKLAPSSQRSFLIGAGTLALGLLLGKFIGGGPVLPEPPTVQRSEIRLPLRLDGFMHSAITSEKGSLAISRDGTKLAYVGYSEGDEHLYIKDAKSGRAERVADTAGASSPFFSPDGSSVGFGLDGTIRRVPVGGGPSVVIAESVNLVKGAAWGDDGNIVFTNGYRTPLLQVSSAGGPITELTTLSEHETTHRYPEFVPNKNILLFEVHTDGIATIWAYEFETGKREKLAAGAMPKYANGNAIFLRNDDADFSIWSAAIDLNNLALTSEAMPLIGGVANQLAVSSSGALIYAKESDEIIDRLLLINRNGDQRVLSNSGTMNKPRFSPDGQKVAISTRITSEYNIWIFPTDGRSLGSQATRDSGRIPIWKFDGSHISYWKRSAAYTIWHLNPGDQRLPLCRPII